jgi:hypothetical protein
MQKHLEIFDYILRRRSGPKCGNFRLAKIAISDWRNSIFRLAKFEILKGGLNCELLASKEYILGKAQYAGGREVRLGTDGACQWD